uniref:GIY-YIG endonuclease superfamily protein n=1 Tax=Burkholderia phage vB_BgluM-SURPRISE13 TaxID=3159457 RepID=A0AAU7PF76_9VIRU
MNQDRIDQILSTELSAVKNGQTKLHRKTHSIHAVYILLLEECDMYYIGSTNDLYKRIYAHTLDLKRNEHGNSSFQKHYNAAKNKALRISFIRVADRDEGYKIEQLLLDKHIGSGKLFNVFTNSAVAGHGGKWSPENKLKQSEVGKRNAITGKMEKAWKSTSKAVSIDGVVYPSISQAARELGVNLNTLMWRFAESKKPGSKFSGIYYYIEP